MQSVKAESSFGSVSMLYAVCLRALKALVPSYLNSYNFFIISFWELWDWHNNEQYNVIIISPQMIKKYKQKVIRKCIRQRRLVSKCLFFKLLFSVENKNIIFLFLCLNVKTNTVTVTVWYMKSMFYLTYYSSRCNEHLSSVARLIV